METESMQTISLTPNSPEIRRVLEEQEKEIIMLKECIQELSQRIKPILLSENPVDCSKDRAKMTTELGETIQLNTDVIYGIKNVVRDLIERIAL